jgi:hypothetical protein
MSKVRARTDDCFFLLAVLGFSFWFFLAVPFASHRETYSWLAIVHTQEFGRAFSFMASTYRPLFQAATWLCFLLLDPKVFPTRATTQAALQILVYALFVLGWWLVYSSSTNKRLFAIVGLLTGGVFFSGYVQLFHIHGIAYGPVMLTIGGLLRFHAWSTTSEISGPRATIVEVLLATLGSILALWHPYASALFVGFYFGYYLDTFSGRDRTQHLMALFILLATTFALAILVIGVPHFWPDVSTHLLQTAERPLDTRLFGSLISYRTNEHNWAASLVAFGLAQLAVLSTPLQSLIIKAAVALMVCVLGGLLFVQQLPLLLLWVGFALLKLLALRCWSLFFLALTAVVLPIGGGIGSPIYALPAIVMSTYATAMEFPKGEALLSFLTPAHVLCSVVVAAAVLCLIRAGVEVPLVERVARPLLAERERTYQLEQMLEWLRASELCSSEIAFTDTAGSPIASIESVLNRQHRPPASLQDVQMFWTNVLQCERSRKPRPLVVITFGGQVLPKATRLYRLQGRYAGEAAVWSAAALPTP